MVSAASSASHPDPDVDVHDTRGDADGENENVLDDVDEDIRADVLKELGNDAFRARMYESAIKHYTESLKHMDDFTQYDDKALRVACLNNRAQARMRLGMHELALQDCETVLESLDEHNVKARFRAAVCSLELGRADACAAHCEAGLRTQPDHAELAALRTRALASTLSGNDAKRVAEQVLQDVERHGYPAPDEHGNVSSPSTLLVVEELVNMLLDADEEVSQGAASSVDVVRTLEQLASALRGDRDARIHFAAIEGHAAVLLHFTHVFHSAASDVLLASIGGDAETPSSTQRKADEESLGVLPPVVMRRLATLALGAGAPPSVASASLSLLERLSRDKMQRLSGSLTLPDSASSAGGVAAEGGGASRVRQTGMLAHLTKSLVKNRGALRKFPLEAARHLVNLLGNFARDSASRSALQKAACAPLVFLLQLYHRAEELLGAFTEADAQAKDLKEADTPEEMRASILRERKRLYNMPVVRLRRAILSTLVDLVRDPLLLRDEAFEVTAASKGKRRRTLAKEEFFAPLVKILRVLIDTSPVQLACIYDADGLPLRYEARPHAADYMATPSGDMMLALPAPTDRDVLETEAHYLRGPYEERKYFMPGYDDKSVYTDLIVTAPAEEKSRKPATSAEMMDMKANPVTLLERCLEVLTQCVVAHKNCGKALYAHRMLDELERLWRFENPPSLLAKLEVLYARIALRAGDGAVSNLVQSASVHTLAGLILTDIPKHIARALNRLSIDVATMDGNSLRRLLRVGGALDKVYGLLCFLDAHPEATEDAAFGAREMPLRGVLDELATAELPPSAPGRRPATGKAVHEMARHIFMTCYERWVSKQDFARWKPPRGLVWDAIGYEEVLLMREKIAGELRPTPAALAAAARKSKKEREAKAASLAATDSFAATAAAPAPAPALTAMPHEPAKEKGDTTGTTAEPDTLPWDPAPAQPTTAKKVATAAASSWSTSSRTPSAKSQQPPAGGHLPWDPQPRKSPAQQSSALSPLPWDPPTRSKTSPEKGDGRKGRREIRRGFFGGPASTAQQQAVSSSALAALGDESTRRLESARAAAAAAEARVNHDTLMVPTGVSASMFDSPDTVGAAAREALASLDDGRSSRTTKAEENSESVGLALGRAAASKAAFATLPPKSTSQEAKASSTATANKKKQAKRAVDGIFGGRRSSSGASRNVGDLDVDEDIVDDGYDSDGLRVEFDSTAPARVRRQREAWLGLDVRRRIRWDQSQREVYVYIKLPYGTLAREVSISVTPTRLTVQLSWHGKVFDGPLSRRCKGSESSWILQDTCTPSPMHHNPTLPEGLPYDEDMGRAGEPFTEVLVMIPKDDPHPWRALFEGGEEKSHYWTLQEMAMVDDEHVSYDEMDEHTKELVDEMRERRQAMASGEIDPDGFDDFRIVLSDADGAK